jgi:hypothetical protein
MSIRRVPGITQISSSCLLELWYSEFLVAVAEYIQYNSWFTGVRNAPVNGCFGPTSAERNWSVFVGDVIVEDSVVREMQTLSDIIL